MAKRIISLIMVVTLSMSMFMLVGCKKEGKIYTLEEAYEKGLIDKDDAMHMAYFLNGSGTVRIENEDGTSRMLEFTPTISKPKLTDLNEGTKEDIVRAYYNKYKKTFDEYLAYYQENHPGLFSNALEFIDGVIGYLGKYNGAYVVGIQSILPTPAFRVVIDGVIINTIDIPILVFKYNWFILHNIKQRR